MAAHCHLLGTRLGHHALFSMCLLQGKNVWCFHFHRLAKITFFFSSRSSKSMNVLLYFVSVDFSQVVLADQASDFFIPSFPFLIDDELTDFHFWAKSSHLLFKSHISPSIQGSPRLGWSLFLDMMLGLYYFLCKGVQVRSASLWLSHPPPTLRGGEKRMMKKNLINNWWSIQSTVPGSDY